MYDVRFVICDVRQGANNGRHFYTCCRRVTFYYYCCCCCCCCCCRRRRRSRCVPGVARRCPHAISSSGWKMITRTENGRCSQPPHLMTIQIIIVMPWCCGSRRVRTPTLLSVGRNGRRSEQQAPPHKRHHPTVMPIKPSTPHPAPSHITFTERVYMLPRQRTTSASSSHSTLHKGFSVQKSAARSWSCRASSLSIGSSKNLLTLRGSKGLGGGVLRWG